MITSYSIVQFVPDTVSEERVNIGIVAWDGEGIHAVTLRDWRRVDSFAFGETRFLRNFANDLERLSSRQRCLPNLGDDGTLELDRLKQIISSWKNTIQFTPVRTSTKEARLLIFDLEKVFLKAKTPVMKRYLRSPAVKRATAVFHQVLLEKGGLDPDKYLHNYEKVDGKLEHHTFDVVVKNGKLISALNTLSFASTQRNQIEREIYATAWKFEDVKKIHSSLPMCVLGIHVENADSKIVKKAHRVFKELNTRLVVPGDLKSWAMKNVNTVAA